MDKIKIEKSHQGIETRPIKIAYDEVSYAAIHLYHYANEHSGMSGMRSKLLDLKVLSRLTISPICLDLSLG